MANPLTEAEIDDLLGELAAWNRDGRSIHRQVMCATFPDAISLVDEVAHEAERMDHHPDIDIRWRTVTFTLTTHAAGGLTHLDVALARRIDDLVAAAS